MILLFDIVSVTVGVMSGGDPGTNAKHSISVPLYFDLAGMVSILTIVPLS